MRDFDDFLAKKLEEESSFPNRDKNWARLSGRLPKGTMPTPNSGSGQALGLWKMLALAGAVGLGLLGWRHARLQEEIITLKSDIVALKQNIEGLQSLKNTPETSDYPLGRQEKSAATQQSSSATDGSLKQEGFSAYDQNNISASGRAISGKSSPPGAIADNKTGFSEEASGAPKLTGIAVAQQPNVPQEPAVADQALVPDTMRLTSPTLRDSLNRAAVIDSSASVQQTFDTLQDEHQSKSAPDTLKKMQPDTAVVAMLPKVQPVRPALGRLRAGVQVNIGFIRPPLSGVNRINGQGISVQSRLISGLWAGGSLNWIRFNEKSSEYETRLHAPHCYPQPPFGGGGPGPGPWDWNLKEVRSSQQQTRLGLGLEFDAPWRFFLRPGVRISHEWVRVAPGTIVFQFEDRHHHGNVDTEYTLKDVDAYWLKNQWKFGAGLHAGIRQWSVSLWLEYARDAANAETGFDALWASAGVQYNFGMRRNPPASGTVQ